MICNKVGIRRPPMVLILVWFIVKPPGPLKDIYCYFKCVVIYIYQFLRSFIKILVPSCHKDTFTVFEASSSLPIQIISAGLNSSQLVSKIFVHIEEHQILFRLGSCLWPPCWQPLSILEEVSAFAFLVVGGMLWFQVELHSTLNLEQYTRAGTLLVPDVFYALWISRKLHYFDSW